MRRIYVLVTSVLAAGLLFDGCRGIFSIYPKNVEFRVISSPSGKKFTGVYGHRGSMTSVGPVQTPKTYITQLEDESDAASGDFRKYDPGTWELRVEVYVDGILKDQASTSEEYGEVTLSVTGWGD